MNELHNIHLNNHNLDYECHDNDSILESGLRKGLSMHYMCNNGSCGSCSAKLIKGNIHKLKHHDYILKPKQKRNNEFLMCCNSPSSDVTLDVDLIGDVRSIKTQNIDTKVKSIDFIGDNLCVLILRTPRSKTLQFMAGQDVELSFKGKTYRYPIASCPCHGLELEFHIRKNTSDQFSQKVFNGTIKAKSLVKLEGPKGIFVLKEDSTRPMVFIACDIGFAPIRSLIEHSFSLEMSNPISFHWAYPFDENSPYLDNHAQSWRVIIDDYNYNPIPYKCSTSSDNCFKEISNFIFNSLDLSSINNSEVYISAPAEVLIYLGELLLNNGLNEYQLTASPV